MAGDGDAAMIGSFEFLPAAPFWSHRAGVLGSLAILLLGVVARKQALASRHRVLRQAADWLLIVSGAAAVAFAGSFAVAKSPSRFQSQSQAHLQSHLQQHSHSQSQEQSQ
jgi:cytochrome c biogenesis protein CcdA